MTDTVEDPIGGDAVPIAGDPTPLRRDIVAVYESMIESVPEAGGDGFESILASLALATDLADLDAPWRSAGLEAYVNVALMLTGIRKMPSEYAGGLPWFLVIDGAVLDTGETVAITTGAVSVVAQLVKAWQLQAFPFKAIPRVADRPSRNGFFPQHLEIVR